MGVAELHCCLLQDAPGCGRIKRAQLVSTWPVPFISQAGRPLQHKCTPCVALPVTPPVRSKLLPLPRPPPHRCEGSGALLAAAFVAPDEGPSSVAPSGAPGASVNSTAGLRTVRSCGTAQG